MAGPKMQTFLYDIGEALKILREAGNSKITATKKVKSTFLDSFLFSGRFNSVLGLDGFETFKDRLKGVVKKVNDDDFGANYINLDDMFETLLWSGVYYVEEHVPEALRHLNSDSRWLTAFRYVAKNFKGIEYSDFRTIVKRFKDSDGHSFFIESGDSEWLHKIATNSKLFRESRDAKASLLQLSQKDLRNICKELDIPAARSAEETISRIIGKAGSRVHGLLPSGITERKNLFIRDEELANGSDLIHIDDYLRSIAKAVREDLAEFINKQRYSTFAA